MINTNKLQVKIIQHFFVQYVYIYNHCHLLTLCVFCCTVVLMAVSTSDSDLFAESVRLLYCSFNFVSAPWRFSLSSGLRLSPRSASNSSTERIASAMPSCLVWRSFCTSWRVNENRFGERTKYVHPANSTSQYQNSIYQLNTVS